MPNKIEHLYIHWPFCRKKCWYCDFTSFAKHEAFMDRYHKALCAEIVDFAKNQPNKQAIKTIFFGGGTPSRYPLHLLANLFSLLKSHFSLESANEITIEVNPGDVTKKELEKWANLGINRLSIGVQILDETILKNVNRFQTNESVKDLLTIAPSYFDNISVDLILGLPGTTSKIWFDSLTYLVNTKISHISVYLLTIYEKTPLCLKINQNEITLPDEDWLMDTYEQTINFLEKNGFFQYEISNFAKKNDIQPDQLNSSKHNLAYWNHKPYKGFGLSAASFDGKKRLVNSHNLLKYLQYWEQGQKKQKICWTIEEPSPSQFFLEKIMLGLRQKRGICLHDVVYSLEEKEKESLLKQIATLKQGGLLEEKDGRIFFTTRGMALENEVIVKLI